jgi:hypothetical protein
LILACHAAPPAALPTAEPAPVAAAPRSPCPAAGEAAEDCPWAAIGRDAATDAHAGLPRLAPAVIGELARDAQAPAMLATWGRALNYNQIANGGYSDDPIVAPAIIDELIARAGAPARQDRVVHAGVQHTYGYLFSVLATPFGFKRARWVQPTVNDGFGLPAGTIAPVPAAGTLLGNVTWLAGAIAFAGEPALADAHSAPALVAPAVQALDVAALHTKRLSETVTVAGREVELRTDFVDFPHPTAAAATWLVYSIREDGKSRLITAFPITAAARDKYESAPTGDAVPITTQYNAWVDGLTGSKLPGRRILK